MALLLAAVAVLLLRFLSRSGGGVPASSSNAVPSAPGSDAADYGPIDTFTDAWARFEGFYQPGSLAQRNNNPVNVKGDWPGVVGHTSSGFAIFDDIGDGWDAARAWVTQNLTEHPDWSFDQLFGKVLGNLDGSPVNNDQGDSNAEANYVAGYLGVPAGSSVADYTQGES